MTFIEELDFKIVDAIVQEALAEDVGGGDITTNALIPHDLECRATVAAKQDCVVAGVPVALALLRSFDPSVRASVRCADGGTAKAGAELMSLEGRARSILTCERTLLNFLQRLSGIATLTRCFVEACGTKRVKILDTRKTTPLLRHVEKYAVRAGGGENHRIGLYDQFLIKDNHLHLMGEIGPNPFGRGIAAARKHAPGIPVEVEIERIEEIDAALDAGADIILFDNMAPETLKEAVAIVGGRALTEASGGITLDNVREYAETGVDRISVGALTHSAKAIDISLDIVE
ncbi:MAG TPA: carboxylating nicotinate-nucleotide diphosphorylase [bacterium]|nr:carboxylating nicotinate-nucleotide diphosphorylase [bacterium]